MLRRCPLDRFVVTAVLLATVGAAVPAHALEIWSGRTFQFVRPDNVDWTQAVNQDRITPNVWLTRKSTQGLFNIKQEAGYSPPSPIDTEWANGNAVDHASLTFKPWVQWTGGNPASTLGVDAVVHLISEDIYIDIRFDSYTGGGSGGGFSYHRAMPSTASVVPGITGFSLRGFLENPARSDAQVEFSLPDAAPAQLEVFDLAGRQLARRDVGPLGAGVHRLRLEGLRAAPTGLVFVRLTREGRSLVVRGTRLR